MNEIFKPLDPLLIPLQGERLIESSAGTGKTFIITALYLRLLLGLGNDVKFLHPLSVENILVVTFTENAAAELRCRIRANIHALRIACLSKNTNNLLFDSILDKISDRKQAAKRLLLAEQKMDEAAIFTIHGFCQRMINLHTFESGVLFEQKLIENEFELRYQACTDFWRRYCYPLAHDIAEVVYAEWKNPEALLRAIDRYLQGEVPIIKYPPLLDETLVSRHNKIISRIIGLKQKWRESSSKIEAIIKNSDIDKHKLNLKNQAKWIESIDDWAHKETRSYQLPNSLKKFSQRFLMERTKLGGVVPKHPLFVAIDDLLEKPLTLNDLVLFHAITKIRDTISLEKRRRGELGFDDMVSHLDKALSNERGKILSAAIRAHFPIAMIDEFQDTDPQQYRIFRHIWHEQPGTALLLIGDPKQSIYTFRGADIFTYIKARSEVKAHYTLDTNQRSAPGMVASVNTLFSQMDTAFIFREIPFLPVKSSEINSNLRFEWQGKNQPSMRFWLINSKGCSVGEYLTVMAQQSAIQIRDLLSAGKRGEALLWRGDIARPVEASDITVLVRNKQEAALIREALALLGIATVYLSNHDSVFNTMEAQEVLWVLQAVLAPECRSKLRRVLASYMLGLTALDIDHINNDESAWNALVEEFIDYHELWKKYGVMSMLSELMTRRQVAENTLANIGGERRLTNFLHIIELLQEISLKLDSKPALIRWLARHIDEPTSNSVNHQIRLESDKHLVQIVTIYKSKGLEYPIVWLPFISNYRFQNQAFYHDRISFEPILDLSQTKESMILAETERLAEDLRLLYVALTRSVWHCSLGIAPLFQHRSKKKGETDFHHSAIGYLIQEGKPKDATGLYLALKNLCNEHIELQISDTIDSSFWEPSEPISTELNVRKIHRKIFDNWQIISYSELQQHRQNIIHDLMPNLNTNTAETIKISEQSVLTPHNFPRGSFSGTFLHRLFENLDFTQPISSEWVLVMLQKNGYESCWKSMLSEWITAILKAPLTNNGISLSQLSEKEKLVEMEFYIPINGLLQTNVLDALARKYDTLSRMCTSLNFRQVNGMLRGFIDLVFQYDGCYYLLDYKSNWLGENREAYTHNSMITAMCLYRYDLQYQLYTLALHRYLRYRIANYNYNTHFGGVIYIFLRGVYTQEPYSYGIFTTKPAEALIESMDQMFAESKQDMI